MRISKKVREQAIEACLGAHDLLLVGGTVDEWLGVDRSASLAWSARNAAIDAVHREGLGIPVPLRWLEAASLLMDGWNPGDPVEVLK